MQMRATDAVGRVTLIPGVPLSFTVNNPTNLAPRGVMTTAANLERVSGVIRVSGHG
ncbi:MAG: hypothetical protein JNL98_09330 [Bryobacterales bacterium]|nr:hypothetical protein [Bryobacterales bacterium]